MLELPSRKSVAFSGRGDIVDYMSYPREEHYPLMAKFGHMVSIWNDVEYQWKFNLGMLENPKEQPTQTAQMVTATLGSFQFIELAKTVVTELVQGEAKSILIEAIRQLDIIREYRNFYVHGFQSVGWRQNGEPVGFLLTFTTKGRYTQHDLAFNENDLDQLIDRLESLRLVFGEVTSALSGGIDPITQLPYPLPDLPAPLERLSKPKRLLFDPPSARDFGNRD